MKNTYSKQEVLELLRQQKQFFLDLLEPYGTDISINDHQAIASRLDEFEPKLPKECAKYKKEYIPNIILSEVINMCDKCLSD